MIIFLSQVNPGSRLFLPSQVGIPPAGFSIYDEAHLLRGKRRFRIEPLSPAPTPPTTRCALGVLGRGTSGGTAGRV